jgi:hypothetical protein
MVYHFIFQNLKSHIKKYFFKRADIMDRFLKKKKSIRCLRGAELERGDSESLSTIFSVILLLST